jgi:putative membrane protein
MSKQRLLISGAFAGILLSQAISPAVASVSTQDFIKKASMGGQFEIQSSEMATKTSQNSQVKAFAQEMITDHDQLGEQLTAVMSKNNIPSDPSADNLDRDHQAMIDQLRDKSGKDFDQAYAKEQLKAHEKTVDMFQDYAKHGQNPALKNFAAQSLVMLQKHTTDAKILKKSLL